MKLLRHHLNCKLYLACLLLLIKTMNRAVSLFKQVTEPDLGFYRTTKTIILTYFNRWRLEFAKNDPCIKMFSESNSFSNFQSFFIEKQLGSITVLSSC